MKKFFSLLMALAIIMCPMMVLAQDTNVMVIDTTIAQQSPLNFDKILTPEALAKLFGTDEKIFIVFIAAILVLVEIVKRKAKYKGQLFFVDNRSLMLPPLVGILLAFIIPNGFSFGMTVRFGLQGAVAAMIIYWLTSILHSERN